MNIENRVVPKSAETHAAPPAYVYSDVGDDEIDLGILLRNLAGEWKAIALVMVIGFLASVAYALSNDSNEWIIGCLVPKRRIDQFSGSPANLWRFFT